MWLFAVLRSIGALQTQTARDALSASGRHGKESLRSGITSRRSPATVRLGCFLLVRLAIRWYDAISARAETVSRPREGDPMAETKTILIVDDDTELSDGLRI